MAANPPRGQLNKENRYNQGMITLIPVLDLPAGFPCEIEMALRYHSTNETTRKAAVVTSQLAHFFKLFDAFSSLPSSTSRLNSVSTQHTTRHTEPPIICHKNTAPFSNRKCDTETKEYKKTPPNDVENHSQTRDNDRVLRPN